MPQRTQNFGQALFRGLSAGAAAVPGALQQKKENTLKDMIAGLQFLREQRAQTESALRMEELKTQNEMANLKLSEATEYLALSHGERGALEAQQQLGKLLGMMNAGGISGAPFTDDLGGSLQAFSQALPTGTTADIGDFRVQGPALPKSPTGEAFKLDFLGPEKYERLLTEGKEPTPKTLSAKDQEYKSMLEREYPSEVAERKWAEYLDPDFDPSESEKRFHTKVRIKQGEGIGFKRLTPAQWASIAKETGYSPQYGKTRNEVLDGTHKNMRAGLPVPPGANTWEEWIAIINQHFDNLYEEIRNFYEKANAER